MRDEEGESAGAVREAGSTRPLSLKDSDSKVVAAVANRAVAALATASAHHAQRGFAAGQRMLRNFVGLETAGREAAVGGQCLWATPDPPFSGFEAAFPSVHHSFMRAMMEAAQIPRSIRNVCKGLCSGAVVQSVFGGARGRHFARCRR